MHADNLQRLEKAIARLRGFVLPEGVNGALDIILREAAEAACVFRREIQDEEWARRLVEMGEEHTYVLRTLDGLECIRRDPYSSFRREIERQEESETADDVVIGASFSVEARKIRRYVFVKWRRGPNRQHVACYQEQQ